MDYNELLNDMKKRLETFEKIPYGQAIGAPWPYSDVGGMVWNDPEPYFLERSINAITELLASAEAAEAAQETLQRTVAEYKDRAEKAERERDAAISTVNNAYRAGAITVKDPRFILPGVESKGWYRTVSVLGDQNVEPNKKVVFRFEDEVSKPSEDQWSWIMGRFMKGE